MTIYYEQITIIDKEIILEGDNATIDGSNSGTVVGFYNCGGNSTVLRGFTIQNGNSSDGGGIYIEGSSPKIEQCIIIGNRASRYGGGIYIASEALIPIIISECIISENENPTGWGGGIY